MDYLEGTGRIIYDPQRPGLKTNTNWWCVVNVDNEIARYYRWWAMKEYWVELVKPSWGAHISIVRGEEPKYKKFWKAYNGEIITFKYSHAVFKTKKEADDGGYFWFIDVICPRLNDIRRELGLRWQRDGVDFTQHITIGRTYY